MDKIQILIVDDHPFFRFGLRARLSTEQDLSVVGEATTGEEAMLLTDTLHPNVVLMDLNMPGINGIEATSQIVAAHPEVAVLVLTMFDDDSVFAAIQAGARGYLLKGVDEEETLRAIRSVANGEAIFSPNIARRLMQYFAAPPMASGTTLFPELTNREREILELMAKGYTNTAIAERLTLSAHTVRNYVSTIFSKLQAADRAEVIKRARQAGLGDQ